MVPMMTMMDMLIISADGTLAKMITIRMLTTVRMVHTYPDVPRQQPIIMLVLQAPVSTAPSCLLNVQNKPVQPRSITDMKELYMLQIMVVTSSTVPGEAHLADSLDWMPLRMLPSIKMHLS